MAERLSTGHVQAQLAHQRTDYANGVLAIFSGTQPSDCNSAETGDLLCLITVASGAFVAGEATNGLNWDAPIAGVLPKAAAEIWSGNGLAAAGAGTAAGWFRFYDNSYTTGASSSALRFDGSISTSSVAELQLSVTTVVEDAPVIINVFNYTPPRS
jgi:hypothetical protein